ncbi:MULTISPECIES: hypothetical protein [unclassified Leisingera]|uniref:hypothetical protein n=1 Tax=unclassified Leisingera TaxID=2614906 RepID=UPI0002EA558D|nr:MULTISPECIES: hypothetical protein [unclassified Leisingera]
MAQKVVPGDLCDIEWSADDVDGNYVVIKGCKTVGIPEESQEYRDRTSLDSPGRSKEWGVGLTDTSELTLNCFYSTSLYEQALAYKAAGKPVYFRVKLPPEDGVQSAGDMFKYQAFLNPSIPSVDQDGDLMTDLKLRPTGLVTWTKGAAV